MFDISHFLKKIADLEDILCQFVEFGVLPEVHVPKTQFKVTGIRPLAAVQNSVLLEANAT